MVMVISLEKDYTYNNNIKTNIINIINGNQISEKNKSSKPSK